MEHPFDINSRSNVEHRNKNHGPACTGSWRPARGMVRFLGATDLGTRSV